MKKIAAGLATVAALGAAAALVLTVSSAASAAVPTHTSKLTVRPVHANGMPVHGYTVVTEKIDSFTCDSGTSPVAVGANIRFCGPSATNTVACWKSTSHTVLCLRDPARRTLVRIRYAGTFAHVAAPKHPAPQRLTLVAKDRSCLIRDGGAWDRVSGHSNWFGSYYCTKADAYGPAKDNGIDESRPVWQVHEVSGSYSAHDQRIVNARVAVAYYVGTAS